MTNDIISWDMDYKVKPKHKHDSKEKHNQNDAEFVEGIDDGAWLYRRYDSEFTVPTKNKRWACKECNNSHVNQHNFPHTTIFFFVEDLHVGKKMAPHMTKSTNKARILPRQVAKSIPFSTEKLPDILNRFSVEASSFQAMLMEQTIIYCESLEIKGEDKYCATSLESIADFGLKHVSDNAQVLMNEIDKPSIPQEYTIMDVNYVGENEVVCHKQNYPYAIYYCHTLIGTKVYNADLVGADGSKAKAVVICHSDTSNWDPKHFAFLALGVKPGSGTICHYIRSDTFVVISGEKITEKAFTEADLLAAA